jgi:L-asparaginase
VSERISIVTTGGTIDKVYFDERSNFEVGESQVPEILRESNVTIDFDVINLMKKDSLQMNEDDRALVRKTIELHAGTRYVVTHGTDTMVETARSLEGLPGKTIVLTGSLSPARFKNSDAVFNVAAAVMAVQCLPAGVYIAMNGRVFRPGQVRKNRDANRFEEA